MEEEKVARQGGFCLLHDNNILIQQAETSYQHIWQGTALQIVFLLTINLGIDHKIRFNSIFWFGVGILLQKKPSICIEAGEEGAYKNKRRTEGRKDREHGMRK